jgi:hypothetical protein
LAIKVLREQKYFLVFFLGSNLTMIESNLTLLDQTKGSLSSPLQPSSDRTGLSIALFLLFLLFLLIAYLFYSFLTFKRLSATPNNQENQFHNKIIFDDNNDLINNNGEIILARQSSFSDCGTSLRSSSIRSHFNPRTKRSSSYKPCSQTSNYLLTPRLSAQLTTTAGDENLSPTIIVEPNDIQLANALSRSISKYYERQRKPKLKQRRHSFDELMIQTPSKRQLQMTTSLPIRRNVRQAERNNRQCPRQSSQTSFRRKPTTIYELYKSDRLRIANLLVSDP